MKYCKQKARQIKADLSTIETELKNCEDACVTDPSVSNLEILEELKMKYDSHFDYLSKDAIIRSRATWCEKGEKNNEYFLGLESLRGKIGCIRKIFTSSGHLTSDPKIIMTEVEQFYSDSYSVNAESSNVSYSLLYKPEIPKLTTEKKNIC